VEMPHFSGWTALARAFRHSPGRMPVGNHAVSAPKTRSSLNPDSGIATSGEHRQAKGSLDGQKMG